MGIKVGICGTGAFADNFVPLFKAHPDVENVILCDLDAERLKEKCEKFGIAESSPSLEDLCERDVDAIAIFTQNDRHAPQAVQALKAGKHVYSAVPSAISMEEITELVKTVEETKQIYMIGETGYYYPWTIFCREKFQKGEFGQIVYSEGEYMHDYAHGFYDLTQWRFGDKWEQMFGMPPLYYPTHSFSLVVSVTGAHVTHVCGMGVADNRGESPWPPKDELEERYRKDNFFAREDNIWKNPFSNESVLARMSDGSVARFNEFRRVGHPGSNGMSMYGTDGSYEQQSKADGAGYSTKGAVWVNKHLDERQDVTDLIACEGVKTEGLMSKITGADVAHEGASKVHEPYLSRLPKEYVGLHNGHAGSHQFLIDDFVKACVSGKTPVNNVWDAARYLVPGLIAHESAMNGSPLMEVPDFGDPKQF
ncbi:MAG: Gfo/Idh/MocA family oxidoreductase [Verrucomicrobiota bacterium]